MGFEPSDAGECSSEGSGSQQQLPLLHSAVVLPSTHSLARRRTVTGWNMLAAVLPCTTWLRHCTLQTLLADVVAGLSVAVMAVPQAVSFAALAGLPAKFGLYGVFVPLVAYAIFGGSPQLAIGPVALVSLLVEQSLMEIIPGADDNIDPNHPDNPEAQEMYNQAAIQLSFLVACIFLVMGAARLGFLTSLLSKPIISSFLSAGAIIISLSQVKYLLGYHVKRTNLVHKLIWSMIEGAEGFKWQEMVMGLVWLALLFSIKGIAARSSKLQWMRALGPITVAAISICSVYIWDLSTRFNIRIVGQIEVGLPPLTVSQWLPISYWPSLSVSALLIAVVDLLETISIGKALADRHGTDLRPNQEIVGLGMANLAGAMFCAYPVTGSFARSAVSDSAGARTGLFGVVTAGVVGLVLVWLSFILSYLPYNALAAIIIAGVVGLIDLSKTVYLFKVSKPDFLVWMVCFLGSLFLGIDAGLGLGVALSLLIVIYETAFPHIAVTDQLPDGPAPQLDPLSREAEPYAATGGLEAPLVIRVDGPLCFANVQYVKDTIAQHQDQQLDNERQATVLVLDMCAVSHIDSTAIDSLTDWIKAYRKRDINFAIANPSKRICEVLSRGGVLDLLGDGRLLTWPPGVAGERGWQESLHNAQITVSSHVDTANNAV